MGRTIVPYSRQMLQIEENLSDFRRSLRRQDQEIFDELMRTAKLQVQAGVMASLPYPIDSMILSMLIDLKKEVNEIKKGLQKIPDK
ncbi:hypothetical protein ND861_11705 [Leptospira sp. 2 VSF19]|uniref:DUF8156 domain-containing protein n=1 Tax=Leptospira soteropolitanensis TaxID=2950025 RepID=A0AAW5VCU9_9LEPT|nr:hypothetical protein [Leptospira soteropolitanensis]MCW7493029.1 hypothetical protein [Leptospira soteropolitanensis]MCW7500901.1 hypothetical protein [Leptospira soteropolitanensis]MCW7522880.1 hypothetical protein [Leptospira soteropolitanensis]MCW7527014.1 hypothetical protein [Leptospira soteropolitanensis]MCW7530598.1 hypothetical protein [Leptospira soteropolitanensis]